jgi:hypothetical protein
MRILTLNLLAAALLLFGATSASAFAINMNLRGPASSYGTSDFVTLDVFLDADPGLTLLGINVIAADTNILTYDPIASAAAPASGSAGPGGQPTYILYTGGKNSSILYPQQTPAWLNWPAPPPGAEQVNINYVEPSFKAAAASGTGIWIATLVWHVDQAFTSTSIYLSMTAGGGILQTGTVVQPPSTIALSAPVVITGHVPEPTTAMLIGLGVLGLGIAGRRRA